MSPAWMVAALLVVALFFYLLGGGADFGGGVWDLLAMGRNAKRERALIEREIGPVWEANHVWFIFVFTVYFAAFPPAFAFTVTALFTPLTVYALGIVLRGAAFTFRHYDPKGSHRRIWTPAFAGASLMCPFLLGAMGAAMAREQSLESRLFDPFTVLSGMLLVSLLAAVAAVYLAVASTEAELQASFRMRAIAALILSGVLGTCALLASRAVAPALLPRVLGSPVWVTTALLGLTAIHALYRRKYRTARGLVAALLGSVVLGWALSKGEVLALGNGVRFTVTSSQAHDATLRTLLWTIAAGALLLIPSLGYLYRVFTHRED